MPPAVAMAQDRHFSTRAVSSLTIAWLIQQAGIAIALEFALLAMICIGESRLHNRSHFAGRLPSSLLNLAMFVVHLVMPIVIITTWKGYYYIRLYDLTSSDYYYCAEKDIYGMGEKYKEWCLDGYAANHGHPLSFPHGDVHTSCILFWAIR